MVIKMEGWRRADYFDATALNWVNPSPNMRSLTQALLYPGIGLLETTNLSVGRGTDTPFEVVGAPWIDHERLAESLNRAGLAGAQVRARALHPEVIEVRRRRVPGRKHYRHGPRLVPPCSRGRRNRLSSEQTTFRRMES